MWGRNSGKAAWQLNPGKDLIKKPPDFINFTFLFGRIFITVCSASFCKSCQGYLLASKPIKPFYLRIIKEVGIPFK